MRIYEVLHSSAKGGDFPYQPSLSAAVEQELREAEREPFMPTGRLKFMTKRGQQLTVLCCLLEQGKVRAADAKADFDQLVDELMYAAAAWD